MQSRNGGWGSFDADNMHFYLNHIPFADHGALLDPPTADVTARCIGFLAQHGASPDHPALATALAYLRREQEEDGSWFGRWGTNYIYGTWSVLAGLNAAGVDPETPEVRRAVAWLIAQQRSDGGWGEAGESYWPDSAARRSAVQHGIADRLGTARADGGGRGRPSGGGARHRLPDREARTATAIGTSRGIPRSVFRACFTCAITATARFSRYGRWRATGTCRWPIRGR